MFRFASRLGPTAHSGSLNLGVDLGLGGADPDSLLLLVHGHEVDRSEHCRLLYRPRPILEGDERSIPFFEFE